MGILLLFLMLALLMLFVLQMFLSVKTPYGQFLLMPLESGFESLKPSLTLSSPYFFLAVLFVLFDLELVFLFPGVVFTMNSLLFVCLWGITMCLVFLTLALEWAWYGLKWQL